MKATEQANYYGVPLRVLSVTPTRDGYRMPSRRMADKHTRTMYGKTLDEWCMLAMWSNECIAHQVFVCETKEHADRLAPIAEKYDVELVVRPPDMLHPANDTGGLPIRWGCDKAMADARAKGEWYGLITTPFVVAPLKRPGLFDEMRTHYIATINNPDYQHSYPCVMGMLANPPGWFWQDHGPGTSAEMVIGNTGRAEYNDMPRAYYGVLQHFIASSWAWFNFQDFVMSRAKVTGIGVYDVIPFNVAWWEDLHIDTQDQWDVAEWAFGKYLGGVEAEDRYREYRNGWAADAVKAAGSGGAK